MYSRICFVFLDISLGSSLRRRCVVLLQIKVVWLRFCCYPKPILFVRCWWRWSLMSMQLRRWRGIVQLVLGIHLATPETSWIDPGIQEN
ncbi:hypothetical protein N665_1602s0006 [Sinapis alba]|nr:hypothetical protein N665_1602s0006 [Sinapis alba]